VTGIPERLTVGGRAVAKAPYAREPFNDDTASFDRLVNLDSTFELEVTSTGGSILARAVNLGPRAAINYPDFVFSFEPTPGVALVGENICRSYFIGALQSGWAFECSFALTFSGAPPEVLGALELHPWIYPVRGPTRVTVRYAPPQDLTIRARRPSGTFAAGSTVPVTVEVANVGLGASKPADALLYSDQALTWSAQGGTVEATDYPPVWKIPALAPGQRVSVEAMATLGAYTLSATLSAVYPDANAENNTAQLALYPSPSGTADLRIENVELRAGAWGAQQIARVTVVNDGPASIDDFERLGIAANHRPINTIAISSVALSPGWSCLDDSCRGTRSMAVGERAVFDFSLSDTINNLWFQAYAGYTTPDPNTGNDARWVWW
jgi:hypothetical protein